MEKYSFEKMKGTIQMHYHYNLQFEKLCNTLNLGEVIKAPEAISGGLLHRMFSLETSKGKYAIKALNPQIMSRTTALSNFVRSERIANTIANRLSAQPAKIIAGKSVQNIDNQFYLVFDWIDGCCLKSHEINIGHCEQMGAVLAEIHKIDFSTIENNSPQYISTEETDWNFYLNKGEVLNSDWVNLLRKNIKHLFNWSDKAKRSSGMLGAEKVISHRDLEPKNVMWFQELPVLIDWESAGYIHPMHDLIETAIYWSINESGFINKERFIAFINGYRKCIGTLKANWKMVLERGYLGKLDWLEYSLKRSLWIECTDENEQHMGTSQVTETIKALKQYEDMVSEMETWLNNDINKEIN